MKKIMVGLTFAAATFSTLAMATPNTASNQSALSPAQVKQVQKIIHRYLVNHPEILVEASQALQQQQIKSAEDKAKQAIVKYSKDLFNNANSPVLGNPKGNVTVVEFMDYQCSHCRDMATVLKKAIKKDPNLRVVIKELPIFGQSSVFASKAALASQRQGEGKYSAFHTALFATPLPFNKSKVLAAAKKAGLNVTQLQQDMKLKAIADQLKDNQALAEKLGLIGTPAFVIGNRNGSKTAFVPGTLTNKTLEELIKKVQ